MKRPQPSSGPRLESAEALAEHAALGFALFVLALAAGVLVAIELRRRRLAWTWALCVLSPLPIWTALALVGLLSPALAVISLAALLALALGAIGWGLRERLEDLRAGGDREAAAKRRRGLLDAARRRRAERPAKRTAALRAGLPVGRTRREELATIGRGTPNSGAHVLIAGATGAGKTTSLASLLVEYVIRSDFARAWLDPERDSGRLLDLRETIARREVAYLRFDTDRSGSVGRAIAQMALLDLGAAASARMGEGVGTFVAIDEFGALEAPALDRLFARGRAAGFSVAVGTQTLADLRAAGPTVRERVGATVSAIVCHRIGEQADAEWVAGLIGAVPAWQSTIRTDALALPTGEGTRTRGYRFQVNPSELQRLDPGEALVARLDRDGEARALRARVVPPWRRLAALGAPGEPEPSQLPNANPDRQRPQKERPQMNVVTLIGNLTKDPELRGDGENPVCQLRLAVNGAKDAPLYVDVAAFGAQAESCARYLSKGRAVAVSGRLRFREWKGRDGAKRGEHSVAADRVDFLAQAPPSADDDQSAGSDA